MSELNNKLYEAEMLLSASVIQQAKDDYKKAMKVFKKERVSAKELSRAVNLYSSVVSPARCDLSPYASYVDMTHDDVIEAFATQFGTANLIEQRARLKSLERAEKFAIFEAEGQFEQLSLLSFFNC